MDKVFIASTRTVFTVKDKESFERLCSVEGDKLILIDETFVDDGGEITDIMVELSKKKDTRVVIV